jgi:hypothetical protein
MHLITAPQGHHKGEGMTGKLDQALASFPHGECSLISRDRKREKKMLTLERNEPRQR